MPIDVPDQKVFEKDFDLAGATLKGVVVDSSRQPVQGASVTATKTDFSLIPNLDLKQNATSGPDGTFPDGSLYARVDARLARLAQLAPLGGGWQGCGRG